MTVKTSIDKNDIAEAWAAIDWRKDWETLNGKRLSAMRSLEAALSCGDLACAQRCIRNALDALGGTR